MIYVQERKPGEGDAGHNRKMKKADRILFTIFAVLSAAYIIVIICGSDFPFVFHITGENIMYALFIVFGLDGIIHFGVLGLICAACEIFSPGKTGIKASGSYKFDRTGELLPFLVFPAHGVLALMHATGLAVIWVPALMV